MNEHEEIPQSGPSEREKDKDVIIAYRKSCDAEGTGLSHYVLMDQAGNRP